jgi:hypothetical protein
MADNRRMPPEKPEEALIRLRSDTTHIQADVTELKKDMRDIRDRLARLEVRVEHLPGKGFVVSVVLTGAALLAAISLFQHQLQTLLGLVH